MNNKILFGVVVLFGLVLASNVNAYTLSPTLIMMMHPAASPDDSIVINISGSAQGAHLDDTYISLDGSTAYGKALQTHGSEISLLSSRRNGSDPMTDTVGNSNMIILHFNLQNYTGIAVPYHIERFMLRLTSTNGIYPPADSFNIYNGSVNSVCPGLAQGTKAGGNFSYVDYISYGGNCYSTEQLIFTASGFPSDYTIFLGGDGYSYDGQLLGQGLYFVPRAAAYNDTSPFFNATMKAIDGVGGYNDLWLRLVQKTYSDYVYSFVSQETNPAIITTVGATINFISFGSVVPIGQTGSAIVSITNNDTVARTFRVGFSIGNSTLGYCDVDCYEGNDIYSYSAKAYDSSTDTWWFGIPTIAPGGTAVLSTPFKYRSDFFTANKNYNVLVTVRSDTSYTILDSKNYTNGVMVTKYTSDTVTKGIYFPITVITAPANFNAVTYYYPITCSIYYTRINRTFTDVDRANNGSMTCGIIGSDIVPDWGTYRVSSEGYDTINGTFNATTDPFIFPLTLYQSTTNCGVIAVRSTQYKCEQLVTDPIYTSSIPTPSGWYCKKNPQTDMPGAYDFYSCYGNITLAGLAINNSYNEYGILEVLATPSTSTGVGGGIYPLASTIATNLGLNTSQAFSFISIIVTIFATGLMMIKTKSKEIGIMVFFAMMILFTMMGWFPAWLFLILTIIAGFIVAKMVGGSLGSGGG